MICQLADGEILEDYRELPANLSGIMRLAQTRRREIYDAVGDLVKSMAVGQLKMVPMEEVKRERLWFRTDLLRDSAFQTIADLHYASEEELASIRGLSRYTAQALHQTVDAMIGFRPTLSWCPCTTSGKHTFWWSARPAP